MPKKSTGKPADAGKNLILNESYLDSDLSKSRELGISPTAILCQVANNLNGVWHMGSIEENEELLERYGALWQTLNS